MKSTSDIMVHSAGTKWKQIESHVKRTQPYYSNKNIDIHHLNKDLDGHLENYNSLMRKQFLPYLEAYNHKCIKQRKKSRMYGIRRKHGKGYRKYHDPVSDYLRHTKRRNERLTIFYLGNKDIRKRYYKVLRGKYGLTTDKIKDMENNALVHTAYIWNARNPYLKVTDFATNTSEKTAHIHTRMAVTGLYGKPRDMAVKSEKKKGIHHFVRKPLMSFNKALVKTYPHAVNSHGRVDSREAMKAMRRRFDPVILKSFNQELAKNGIHLSLGLTRTGKANHFTLRAYQANKDMKRSYSKIAKQIQSAIPNMTHGDKPATYQNYYNLATGKEYFHLSNGSNVSGVDVLGAVNSQSLANQKQSIKAEYRSSAVSEAQPLVHQQVAKSGSQAQESASDSASQSLSATISSLNRSLASSQADWTDSMNSQLSASASKSASAKVKASVQASVATSTAQLQSSSNSLASNNVAMISEKVQMIKSFSPIHYGNKSDGTYRLPTDSEYSNFAKHGVSFNDGSSLTANQLITSGVSHNASSIASASSSISTASSSVNALHDETRDMMTNELMAYGNQSEDGTGRSNPTSYRQRIWNTRSDKTVVHNFSHMLKRFIGSHEWAEKVADKLHKYHEHLKKLFKHFLPKISDSIITGLANGTKAPKYNNHLTQESYLFKLEDEHAKDITHQAANKQVYKDNQNYHTPREPGDDGLDGP